MPEYETQHQALEEMTVEEMQDEIRKWRAMWSWLDEPVKYHITKIGQLCRYVGRNFKGHLGHFGQPHFQLTEIEMDATEVEYNYDDGKRYLESKTLKIPASNIVQLEFIAEREVTVDVLSARDVQSIPDEILERALRGEVEER